MRNTRYTTDPETRFCVQCGARRCEHAFQDRTRCHDCAGGPIVAARFNTQTGARLNPPAPEYRPLLSSYGAWLDVGTAGRMPGVAHHDRIDATNARERASVRNP